MGDIIDIIGEVFWDWIDGLGNLIGDLGIDDILSGIIGFIPRTIMYVRSLVTPVYYFVDELFGIYTALLFFTVIGFIVILAIRRGVK